MTQPPSLKPLLALLPELVEQLPAGLTVLDPQGKVLYYNPAAAEFLDRKPEYIGRDVRQFHQPATNRKVDAILASYRKGSRKAHTWQFNREGKILQIRVRPLVVEGRFVALLHNVLPVKAQSAPNPDDVE